MRQHLAVLGCAFVVGGCSLIYNPSNIGPGGKDATIDAPPDAPPDAEIILDTNPAALALTGVTPTELDEGQGSAGGRPTVLYIDGSQITADATITLVSSDDTKTVHLTLGPPVVAADGRAIAVAVHCDVDAALPEGPLLLDVIVNQPGVAAPVKLVGLVTYHAHNELSSSDGSASIALDASTTFSAVTYAGTIKPKAGATAPLVIHSFSTLSVGAIDVTNAGTSGFAGGNAGGASGAAGGGTGGGKSPGGGAGFAIQNAGTNGGAPSGEQALKTLDAPDRGNGGGGGGGIGCGGTGGGGGGSLSVTSGGPMTIGAVRSNGGGGTGAGLLCTAGGGGSGGAVVLRAGTTLGATAIAVDGGTAGPANGGTAGQVGGPGRVRIDQSTAPTATVSSAGASVYRGPMFASAGANVPPIVTQTLRPVFDFVGQPLTNFNFYVVDASGFLHNITGNTFSDTGVAQVMLDFDLGRGPNRVCAAVEGATSADSTNAQSASCVDVVYVFKPTM